MIALLIHARHWLYLTESYFLFTPSKTRIRNHFHFFLFTPVNAYSLLCTTHNCLLNNTILHQQIPFSIFSTLTTRSAWRRTRGQPSAVLRAAPPASNRTCRSERAAAPGRPRSGRRRGLGKEDEESKMGSSEYVGWLWWRRLETLSEAIDA